MKDTKAERIFRLVTQLQTMGFSREEVTKLLRIQGTLRSWAEEECNGTIQRDEDNGNKPVGFREDFRGFHHKLGAIPDREAGALKRLAAIMANHPEAVAYHQSDPRGCALYIVSKTDLNGSKIDEVYTRGVAVCV